MVFELFIHILKDLLLVEPIFFALVEDEGVQKVYQFYCTVSAILVLEGAQQLAGLFQRQPSILFLLHHIIYNISSPLIHLLGIIKEMMDT